jgi:hypothetical protein
VKQFIEHFDMCLVKTVAEAHSNFQESIMNWGRLLIATGGALKSSKCFFQLIFFSGNLMEHGSMRKNHANPEYRIAVMLEDRRHIEIEHLY